jgi:hypothetical protein
VIGELTETSELVRVRIVAELVEGRVSRQPGDAVCGQIGWGRRLAPVESQVTMQIIGARNPIKPAAWVGDEPRLLDEGFPDAVVEQIERNGEKVPPRSA